MAKKTITKCMYLDNEKTYCGKDIWVHSAAWFWKRVTCKDCLKIKNGQNI